VVVAVVAVVAVVVVAVAVAVVAVVVVAVAVVVVVAFAVGFAAWGIIKCFRHGGVSCLPFPFSRDVTQYRVPILLLVRDLVRVDAFGLVLLP